MLFYAGFFETADFAFGESLELRILSGLPCCWLEWLTYDAGVFVSKGDSRTSELASDIFRLPSMK